MTTEEVKFFSILLGVGEYIEYKNFIDSILNNDCEIDDLIADLLLAGENYSKCCDILSSFYKNKIVDDTIVVFSLIEYTKNKLKSGEWDKNRAIEMFVKFTQEANKFHEDKINEPWATMKLLGLILDKNNSIVYESDFDDFVNFGKLLTENNDIQTKLKSLF